VQTQKKTEKSLTELVCVHLAIESRLFVTEDDDQQIEHNLNYDFSLTDESGNALEPVFGPGLTGLQNLGNRCVYLPTLGYSSTPQQTNSCYMASVIQVLFTLPPFQRRYATSLSNQHWLSCAESLPATCLECQMHKLADGLLSGRYSHPRRTDENTALQNPLAGPAETAPPPVFQDGVRPATFKALVGRGHAEFATMRQQDAEEFLTHLLTSLRRYARAHPRDGSGSEPEPTETFAFALEQRLQCTECAGVRYRVDAHDLLSVPVPAREKGRDADGKVLYEDAALAECVEVAMGIEGLEYKCPNCRRDIAATR
jgi:ubiquitin carboxyl-terminal hydrolase 5/13